MSLILRHLQKLRIYEKAALRPECITRNQHSCATPRKDNQASAQFRCME
jgi:hypothetical protein